MNTTFIRCKVLSLPLLLLLIAASFQSQAFAQQCPDGDCPPAPTGDAQSDPTPIRWQTASACVDLNGDGCIYKICYAYRQTSANNYDYMITQVSWMEGCDPEDLNQLLVDASWWVMQNNPQNFPCPPCPQSIIEWTENFVTCWKYVTFSGPQGGGKKIAICHEKGWCLHAYRVCCDNTGAKTFTHIRDVNTTWQCASEPPAPGEQFITNCTQYDCPPIH